MTSDRTCLAIALVAGFLAPVAALADGTGDGHHGMYAMWGGGWGGMLFGFQMMVAVIAAIVVAVVLLTRALGGGGRGRPAGSARGDALDILEARFARGEIDREEFEERRRILSEG